MKLPQLQPQTGIPLAPYEKASPGAFAAPYETLERGATKLEGEGLKIAGAIEQTQNAKKLFAIRTDAAALKSQVELEAVQADSALRQTVTDPDEYLAQHTAMVAQLKEGLADRVKHPETLALLDQQLPAVWTARQVEAQHHADKLFVDRAEGQLTRTLDNQTQLAGLVPLGNDGAFAQHYADANAAIGTFEPLIGSKRAEALRVKTREGMFDERARRHSIEAPAGFLASGEKYQGMDPMRRDTYIAQAETRVLAQRKADLAEFDKWEKAIEHDAELERRAQVDALDSQAEQNTLTRRALEDARIMRIATGEDYRRLSKALDAPDKKTVSDPETLQRLTLDVYSATPRTKDADINRAALDGTLTTADARALKNRLREREDFFRTQGTSEAGRRQAQAEQLIITGLTTTSPFEKLDPVAQKAKLLALQEVTRRSNAFKGTEDPLTVAEEILPRYMGTLIGNNRLSADKLKVTLKYADPAALDAARAAGQISPGDYETQRRLFLDWDQAEKDAAAAKARLDALKGGASGKPTGSGVKGYRGSGADMGRKPGE